MVNYIQETRATRRIFIFIGPVKKKKKEPIFRKTFRVLRGLICLSCIINCSLSFKKFFVELK